MKTYVVYEQRSGRIVHVHNAAGDEQLSHERIVRYAHQSLNRSELASIEVDPAELDPEAAYRVDPQTRRLERAQAGARAGAGVESSPTR
jgi:hypothetical protein